MNSELTVTAKTYLTPSEATLARELDVTAENAATTVSMELLKEWFREFSGDAAERLAEAFRRWRRRSPFFPKISEIRELMGDGGGLDYTEKCGREFAGWRLEVERGRARGEVKSFAEWCEADAGLRSTVEELKRKVVLPSPANRKVFEMPRRAPPGVVLSAEEIEKRRASELEEIRRYDKSND